MTYYPIAVPCKISHCLGSMQKLELTDLLQQIDIKASMIPGTRTDPGQSVSEGVIFIQFVAMYDSSRDSHTSSS